MTDTVLEVSGLTVRFGGVMAVDDVEFSVQRGQILGLVGPNGAGKTTIFDALCGFVAARGKVVLDGRDISDLQPEARAKARLGRSFQDAKMFPSLTVTEALAVAFERHIRAHGVVSSGLGLPWVRRAEKRVSRRVDELIELMGLGAFRDKFISELSTGSRRIVDLAAIIAHDPVVLLLDEPSSGIAQREAEALGPLLLKIRKDTQTTMLVVEHDMPLLRSISDQILALETGRVLTIGAPDEVLSDPRLVAAYLGSDQAVVARSGAAPPGRPARAPARAPVTGATGAAPRRATRRARPAATARTAAGRQASSGPGSASGSMSGSASGSRTRAPATKPAGKAAVRATTAAAKAAAAATRAATTGPAATKKAAAKAATKTRAKPAKATAGAIALPDARPGPELAVHGSPAPINGRAGSSSTNGATKRIDRERASAARERVSAARERVSAARDTA